MTKIFFGGTSGSFPTKYVNRGSVYTTSICIFDQDMGYLIDQGSGVNFSSEYLLEKNVKEVTLLQTHYHIDHVQGIPMNQVLYRANDLQLQMYGPKIQKGLEFAMESILDETIWPTPPDFKNYTFHINSIDDLKKVQQFDLIHPGGSVGYRIETSRGVVVVATDHEHGVEHNDLMYAAHVDGSKILIADIQFSDEEYDGQVGLGKMPPAPKKGWGHSSPRLVANCLKLCKIPPTKIYITHHDPRHDIVQLHEIKSSLQKELVSNVLKSEVELALDHLEIDV